MDLLSHALIGGLVASVSLQRKYGLVASATMVAASLLPDLDGLAMVLGPRYFLQYHRHPLTHSLGGAVLLSAALAVVVGLTTPLKRPGLVFAIGLAGMLLHLVADLLTPWPIPIFFPLSTRTYSLDLINFLDPFLLIVLGVSYFVASRWPERGALVVGLALLAIAGYLGFRASGKQAAEELVRGRSPASSITALPHGLSPVAWDVVAQEAGGYILYVVDSLRGEVRGRQVVPSASDEWARAAGSRSPLVQAFLRRARFPVMLVAREESRTIVEWRDAHLLASGGVLSGVRVVLDEQGQTVEERLELGGRR